jgi:hypothetical protein
VRDRQAGSVGLTEILWIVLLALLILFVASRL